MNSIGTCRLHSLKLQVVLSGGDTLFFVVVGNKKKFALYSLIMLFVLGLLFGGIFVTGRTIVVSSSYKLVPVYRVARKENVVSLTLDATWGDDNTLALLDLFDKYDVKVTFFLAGNWIKEYPDMVKEISKRGHEIGNHSLTHPHMSQISIDQMKKELLDTESMIYDLTGTKTENFRPPFGDYNNDLIATAKECGYTTVQWSIDSLDWKDLSADEIYSRVMNKISSGDIVLFHNAGKYTLEGLERIIRDLKENGYHITTVSELLLKGDTYTDKTTGEQRFANLSN